MIDIPHIEHSGLNEAIYMNRSGNYKNTADPALLYVSLHHIRKEPFSAFRIALEGFETTYEGVQRQALINYSSAVNSLRESVYKQYPNGIDIAGLTHGELKPNINDLKVRAK